MTLPRTMPLKTSELLTMLHLCDAARVEGADRRWRSSDTSNKSYTSPVRTAYGRGTDEHRSLPFSGRLARVHWSEPGTFLIWRHVDELQWQIVESSFNDPSRFYGGGAGAGDG